MNVLFATSEAYPFAVSGGLGDVAYALPKALRAKDVDCRVIMPLYSKISQELRDKMRFVTSISVPVAWRSQYCGIFEADHLGVNYIFIDNEFYFKRGGLYGEFDDGERYAFFSRAVLEVIPHINFKPDVIHCNDWQTALVPTYYKFFYYNRYGYENIKTVMTIHNIQYQGRYGLDIIEDVLGIPTWATSVIENDGDVNFLKSGIESADKITTVSPTYAGELADPWFAYGLSGIICNRYWKMCGILNGIDVDVYDPSKDKDIAKTYTSKTLLKNKPLNKEALQKELGLEVNPDIPLLCMVTRLAGHKGVDLVKYVFDDIMQRNIQVAILGSGEYEYEQFFHAKAQQYGGKFAFVCGFVPALSHRFYAGSDLFLMPSKQEPCGLSQMIALRYGTVPIVRQTGGLADTVKDVGEPDGVGYTFKSYNAHDMMGAIDRGLGLYANKPEWNKVIKRDMEIDNSWNRSADAYIGLYKEIIG